MFKTLELGNLTRIFRRHPKRTELSPEDQRYQAAYINWQLEQQLLRETGHYHPIVK